MPRLIYIRFYQELNDFLPPDRRKRTFQHSYYGNMTIKDVIESLGVPHTEIDMILVNRESVGFSYKPCNDDFVSVYPVFESIDISSVTKLRPKPLRHSRFILDVHLGKLAKYLRMLGFDTLYQNDFEDQQIIDISVNEKRIILTRDIGILKNSKVTHGYWIRSQHPGEQVTEVIQRFDLARSIKPLNRCIECNGKITSVDKNEVIGQLKPKTFRYFDEFYRCANCGKVYWEGSHFSKMLNKIDLFMEGKQAENK
jgi:uncharacterized protein with PIN domain